MNDKKNIFIAILILIILALAIWLWKEKDSDDVVIINNNQQSQLPTTSVEDNISSPAQPVGQQIQPADKAPVPFSESFASGNWLLNAVTLKGKVVDMNINVPAPLTLNFDKAKKGYTGFAGCNSFSGTYAASAPNNFSFGSTVSTKKACPATTALENSIFSAMSAVSEFTILPNGHLLIQSADGTTKIDYQPAI